MRFTLAFALLLGFAVLLRAQPAYCAYCGNLSCMYSSNCFQGCFCATGPSGGPGICVNGSDR